MTMTKMKLVSFMKGLNTGLISKEILIEKIREKWGVSDYIVKDRMKWLAKLELIVPSNRNPEVFIVVV